MGKVLKFKDDNIVTVLVDLLEMAKSGELKSILFAGKVEDGNIVSGWSNATPGHRQELIGHIQIDVMVAVMERNYILERDEE